MMLTFAQFLTEGRVTRLDTSRIAAVLLKAGKRATTMTRREGRKPGYYLTQHSPYAVVVHSMWVTPNSNNERIMGDSQELEAILTSAGFKVTRPFPDTTLLGVTTMPTVSESAEKPYPLLALSTIETLQPGYLDIRTYWGSVATPDEKKLALAILDRDRAIVADYPLREIEMDLLVPTQESVKLSDVEKFMTGSGNDPIFVVKYQGRYLIADGHHRAAADRANQQTTIQAYVAQEN